jgi:hypothetical protein
MSSQAHAQPANDFSLQVTPSPLVTTVKPGQKTELELKIRNGGSSVEELKIEPRSFTLGNDGSTIKLNDTTPPDIAQWISFSEPSFKVQPGQWYTQKVRFSLPKDTGFSYSFALVVSRKNAPSVTSNGRVLKGSVAVFTLVNVDRPGASRKLNIASFGTSKRVYEYIPSELSLRLTNGGNSIVQPYGNIYIQRKSNDSKPIATLAVNEKKGYILPNSTRTLTTNWNDGFPVYTVSTDESGTEQRKLSWNWKNIANFRIGKYTAKLVAVYNDGQRDIPLESEVTFWVIPWKIIGGLAIVSLLAILGLWSFARKLLRFAKKFNKKHTLNPSEKA